MATYLRRRYRAPETSARYLETGGEEFELYGEVELQRGPAGIWWYGRWYSCVMPAGVAGGVAVGSADLEEIGHAEFEMARSQHWALGPHVDVDDEVARADGHLWSRHEIAD